MIFTLFYVIPFLLLICASAFFSGSETALFSLPATKVKAYSSSNDRRKRLVAQLLSQPRDLLVTVFMLNTLINILLQNVVSNGAGEAASWWYKVAFPFIVVLLFCEVIPKYIFLQNNATLSIWTAPWVNLCHRLVAPFRKFVVTVTIPTSRLLFFFLKPEKEISVQELQHALKASERKGVLDEDESQLLRGYLNLQDSQVKELMRPREDVLFYDMNDPLSKLTHLFVDEQCTRLPVCKGDLDQVVGVMTAQNYFFHSHSFREPKDIESYLQKPFYVPETTQGQFLLRQLNACNEEIALVVNEYGSISGLITYEDLVEVVIGEIADLRDQKSMYTKTGTHELIANGKMELEELNNLFETNLMSKSNMVTIGGWLTEQLGEIPKAGTKVDLPPYHFHVLASDPKRVNRLFVRFMSPSKSRGK